MFAAYDLLKNVVNPPKNEGFLAFGEYITIKLQKLYDKVQSVDALNE